MEFPLLKFTVSPPETPSESIVTLAFRLAVDAPAPPLSIRAPNVSLTSLFGNVAVVGAELNDQLPPSFQFPVVPLDQVAVIAAPQAAGAQAITAAMAVAAPQFRTRPLYFTVIFRPVPASRGKREFLSPVKTILTARFRPISLNYFISII